MLFNALMRGGITLFIVFYLATTLLWSISPRTHRDILSQLRQDYLREHKAGKDIDHLPCRNFAYNCTCSGRSDQSRCQENCKADPLASS
jgi:hypothetical protein